MPDDDVMADPYEWIKEGERRAEDQWKAEHEKAKRDDLPESEILMEVLLTRGFLSKTGRLIAHELNSGGLIVHETFVCRRRVEDMHVTARYL